MDSKQKSDEVGTTTCLENVTKNRAKGPRGRRLPNRMKQKSTVRSSEENELRQQLTSPTSPPANGVKEKFSSSPKTNSETKWTRPSVKEKVDQGESADVPNQRSDSIFGNPHLQRARGSSKKKPPKPLPKPKKSDLVNIGIHLPTRATAVTREPEVKQEAGGTPEARLFSSPEPKRNTHKSHDYYNLQESFGDAMMDLARFIDEVRSDIETLQKIKQIQNSITNMEMPENLELKDYGRLLIDGELKIRSSEDNILKNRYVFIFEKVMLICKSTRDGLYKFKEALALVNYKVEDSPIVQITLATKDEWIYSWLLTHRQDETDLIIYADTEERKQKWMDAIHLALDAVWPSSLRCTDHQFQLHSFDKATSCAGCKRLLKGIFHQGYLCTECNVAVHKECLPNVRGCGASMAGGSEASTGAAAGAYGEKAGTEAGESYGSVYGASSSEVVGTSAAGTDGYNHESHGDAHGVDACAVAGADSDEAAGGSYLEKDYAMDIVSNSISRLSSTSAASRIASAVKSFKSKGVPNEDSLSNVISTISSSVAGNNPGLPECEIAVQTLMEVIAALLHILSTS